MITEYICKSFFGTLEGKEHTIDSEVLEIIALNFSLVLTSFIPSADYNLHAEAIQEDIYLSSWMLQLKSKFLNYIYQHK